MAMSAELRPAAIAVVRRRYRAKASARSGRSCQPLFAQASGFGLKRVAPGRVRQKFGGLIEKGRRSSVGLNDAHLTADHIDELRQDLKAGEPQDFAHFGGLLPPAREIPIRNVRQRPEL